MPIPPRYPLISEMRVEQVTANQVRTILLNTSSRLDREIRKMDDSTNPVTRMQAEAQRAAVQGYMDQDWKDIEKSVVSGRVAAASEASRVVSRYENQLLGMVMDKKAMDALSKSEAQRAASGVDAAVRRMQGKSYIPLSKQVYYTQAIADGWVDETINQALAAGWSQKKLAKAVRDHISPNVPGGVSYAANRLARTEVNNAFHASAAKRYEDSVLVEGIDWHLSSSHPEGDICDSLAAGSPYKKGKVPRKPHPHCYCFLTPALPSDEEFIENLFAGKYGDEPWVAQTNPKKMADTWNAKGDQELQAKFTKGWKQDRILSEDSAAGQVVKVKFSDGTYGVLKPLEMFEDDIEQQIGSEILSSRIASSLGVRAPKVAVVDGPYGPSILSEFQAGTVGHEAVSYTGVGNPVKKYLREKMDDSDSGAREMAWMDYVINNTDRNMGNWIVSDGKMIAIDHGETLLGAGTNSFLYRDEVADAMREAYLDGTMGPFPYNAWKDELGKLKPAFQEQGRAKDYDMMMERLDNLRDTIRADYEGVVA
jgi:hypothetical protein